MTATLPDRPAPADRTRPRFSVLRRRARADREGGLDDQPLAVAAGLADDVDRLAPFGPAILAVRWATTTMSVALSIPAFAAGDMWTVFWCGVLVGHSLLRTITPPRYSGDTRSLVLALVDLAVPLLGVVATGYWNSPLVFSLFTAVVVAGFARGFAFGIRVAVVQIVAVGVPALTRVAYADPGEDSVPQWGVVLLLLAVVAGYGRRISGEADRQHTVALERLGRLADANELLFSLHRVTQTLPASFDFEEVLDTTATRLRELFGAAGTAILVADESEDVWLTARHHGGRVPERLTDEDLPAPLREVLQTDAVVSAPSLLGAGGPGLMTRMASGIYAPLRARGATIGLVAVEQSQEQRFTQRDIDLLGGFADPAALAIDNARWFARLRTVGADEERTRIARDLHDRIGQSLAYLAFELDRIVDEDRQGAAIGDSLEHLRADVRGVIGEVRDTLYDLRTDVSETEAIGEVLRQFARRVDERADVEIEVHAHDDHRLPLLQEREMWRIAQEALVNVERHATARHARVVWTCTASAAALEVTDDGKGFPEGTIGRFDSYGIMGMRERASSIGASLEIASAPGQGTRVRCLLRQG